MPPQSETGKPVLEARIAEAFSFRQPAALVFLSASDAASCCAANYERIVFMDRQVLKLTKPILTLRLDRAATEKETLERYGVDPKKPAIVITDCEGEVVSRFDTCVNAREVAAAMTLALKASKQKISLAKKVQKLLEEASEELAAARIHEASLLLRKVLNTKGAPAAGGERATRVLGELAAEGQRRYEAAEALESLTGRYDRLLELRHDFVLYDELIKPVRVAIVALEEGEETKQEIFVHQGMKEVERAIGLLERDGVRARSLLREVRYKWKDTPAAERAQRVLDRE